MALFFCDKSVKSIYIIYKNKTSRRLRKVENMIKKRNIVLAVVLSIITCGIYSWYWAYRMGAKVDKLKNGGSHTILFIVLQIFGLGIVNYCILQDTVNNYAED